MRFLTDYVDGLAPLEFMPGELASLDGIEPGFDCFALFCRGERYAFLATRLVGDGSNIEVHLVVKRFGAQRMKKLRDQFRQFQRWCAHNGITEVCTFKLPAENGPDRKWKRFVRLLGFGAVQTMYLTQKPVEV